LQQASVNAVSAVGDTTVTLISASYLSVDDFLYLPFAPSETGEKAVIASISGQIVTLDTALAYPHFKNETVTKVFGDQLKFYAAVAPTDNSVPTDASFYALSGGTVDIDPQQLETSFTDPAGGQGFWYRFTHYNSVTHAETDVSACPPIRGGSYGHYVSIYDIRCEAGFKNNPNIEDAEIDSYRRRAESEVDGSLAMAYILPLPSTPYLIEYATLKLAAGYLLCKDYSPYQLGENHEGLGKISEARALLNRISTRQIMLPDIRENILKNDQSVAGWPNDSTSTFTGNGGDNGYMFDTARKY
jgi:hypothetical protein